MLNSHPGPMNTQIRPIVLLTDFGLQDWFVGVMKGEILKINPSALIVDLCHAIEPGSIEQAAWLLKETAVNFPRGSVFCTIVDPGVGTARRAIVAQADDKFFIAPDNGLLAPIQAEAKNWACFQITATEWMGAQRSATFHGRDIFAPVAAHCSVGNAIDSAGAPCNDIKELVLTKPDWSVSGMVTVKIMHVDRFGNLILNLKNETMNKAAADGEISCVIGEEKICGIHKTFGEVRSGKALLYWGSLDYLELAVNQGSAADRFQLKPGDSLRLLIDE